MIDGAKKANDVLKEQLKEKEEQINLMKELNLKLQIENKHLTDQLNRERNSPC